MDVVPIECYLGCRRLVRGPNQAAIRGGQPHQITQVSFGPVKLTQIVFHA